MQKLIKQTSPSRYLLETVNFAYMKFFDSLVKITIFWAFLLFFWEIRVTRSAPFKCSIAAVMHDANLPKNREMPKKWLF